MAINRKKLQEYLDTFYKPNFEVITDNEIYKWDAMLNFRSIHFLDGWYDEAEQFYSRFSEALDSLENLLNGKKYYANTCLRDCAKAYPVETKKALSDLNYAGQSGINVVAAMDKFEATMRELTAIIKKEEIYVKSFQGYRAVALLLFFMYPEKYFFFKSHEYDEMRKITEFVPESGRSDYEYCQLLSKEILDVVKQDSELCAWYEDRRYKYDGIDPDYHLLVQDILWSSQYYEKYKDKPMPRIGEDGKTGKRWEVITHPSFSEPDINLKAKKGIDFENEQRRKKELGLAGERFVLRCETERLQKLFPNDKSKRPIHTSLEGDGAGYDILSYDENGDKVFIEVKTTSGAYSEPIHLTRSEYKRSIACPKEFRLYRVYNFKDGVGDVGITPGSMERICQYAESYIVSLKK